VTRTFLWLHKWLGICIGVVVFVWVVSGVVLILPRRAVPRAPAAAMDWSQASLSPGQIAALVAATGDSGEIQDLSLIRLRNRPVFLAEIRKGRRHLLDAATGAPIEITAQLAESIAVEGLRTPAPVTGVERLTRHDWRYSGALPAYRVVFDDARRTVAYVIERDGNLVLGDRGIRIRAVIAGLHTFQPLRLLTGNTSRVFSLYLTSVVAVLLVLTGYYLVLPKKWRRRRPRAASGN